MAEQLRKLAPPVAAAVVLLAGAPSACALFLHYLGNALPHHLVGFLWSVVWLALVPSLSFLLAHLLAGVGGKQAERAPGGALSTALSGSLVIFVGVVLPMMSMVVLVPELSGYGFREDPAFTLWHVFLMALIPVGILVPWESVARGRVASPSICGMLMGAALGVSATYALVSVHLLFRLGHVVGPSPSMVLLAVPMLALACAVVVWVKLRAMYADAASVKANRLVALGLLLSLSALFLPEAAPAMARNGISWATSDSFSQRRAGVRLLRGLGLEETVLRYCYSEMLPPLALSELMPWHKPGDNMRVTAADARLVYWRMTGTPFNAVPRPGQWGGLWLRWRDTDVAGEQVGARADGVTLAGSSIDGVVDAESGVGHLEWVLSFENGSEYDQEARALLELPPGAVVSRAARIVGHRKREALFKERSAARIAYQTMVEYQRQPLLVTEVAPGRVLVQCYPIPPRSRSGPIKILIGVALPLVLENLHTSHLCLPRIVESNFDLSAAHRVNLTSLQPPTRSSLSLRQAAAGNAGGAQLDGWLSQDEVLRCPSIVELTPPSAPQQAGKVYPVPASGMGHGPVRQEHGLTSGDHFAVSAGPYRQKPQQQGAATVRGVGAGSAAAPDDGKLPQHLYVVIDGSQSMRGQIDVVARALKAVPAGMKVWVLFASDEITRASPEGEKPVALPLEQALSELPLLPCLGGPDNTPALYQAWQMACQGGNAAVLWVHGPQPTLFDNPGAIAASFQRSRRPGARVRMYEVEVAPGRNQIAETMFALTRDPSSPLQFHRVARLRSLEKDVQLLLKTWSDPAGTGSQTEHQHRPGAPKNARIARAVIDLRVRQQVDELLTRGDNVQAAKAACQYGLVTPATSAVILDDEESYRRSGQGLPLVSEVKPDQRQVSVPPLEAPAVRGSLFKLGPGDHRFLRAQRVAAPPPSAYQPPPREAPPVRPHNYSSWRHLPVRTSYQPIAKDQGSGHGNAASYGGEWPGGYSAYPTVTEARVDISDGASLPDEALSAVPVTIASSLPRSSKQSVIPGQVHSLTGGGSSVEPQGGGRYRHRHQYRGPASAQEEADNLTSAFARSLRKSAANDIGTWLTVVLLSLGAILLAWRWCKVVATKP
jgi:hypothetical protein